MKEVQNVTLKVFLTLMTVCAVLMLSFVWSGPIKGPTVLVQCAISCFIVGLASFLVWLVTVILEIRDKIEK